MAPRKRGHAAMNANDHETGTDAAPPSLLSRVRNTWHFACLMQFIQTFGNALKIDDDLDIETLEEECIKTKSDRLAELGLTLLKWISSHRGLTHELFDEYTRRQYMAKAPERNPYGTEEEPRHFSDFDIFLKLKVLHQLSVWTFNNPDRIRERMEEKDSQQTQWRIEPFGYDARGRSYYVFDDFRLYRLTDAPPPLPTPKKAKTKAKPKSKASAPRRSSKRQKMSNGDAAEDDGVEDNEAEDTEEPKNEVPEDDGLGGASWECLAITLEEYQAFLESIKKSKNADEKDLHQSLVDDIMPKLEKEAEARERKQAKRLRELQALEKLATAKRSSRLAGKQERQKELDEAEAAERKKQEELVMAHKEQQRQQKLEQDRESRMMTREQRLKDREVKRILHEEELSKLERSQSVDSETYRSSERNRKSQAEKKLRDIELLKQEIASSNDEWYFDCSVCGKHGKNFDDGEHSLACERCNVWQHSKCHAISEQEAERDDFHFVCNSCTNYKSMKLNFSKPSPSAEIKTNGHAPAGMRINGQPASGPPKQLFNTTKTAAKPLLQHSQQHTEHRPEQHSHHSLGRVQVNATHAVPNGYPPVQHQPQGQSQQLNQYHNSHNNPYHASGYPPYSRSSQQPPVNADLSSLQRPQSVQQHDPFLNRFDRQPPAPHSNSRPNSSHSNGPSMTSPQPSSNPSAPPMIANSPTPSLSATQGSTDVRFSPSQPLSSFSFNNTTSNPPHLAYAPAVNQPAASAYSPRKQSSPPSYPSPWPNHATPRAAQQGPSPYHHPSHGQHQQSQLQQPRMPNGVATTPSGPSNLANPAAPPDTSPLASSPHFPPTPSAASNTAAAGISPTKHDQNPPPPPPATVLQKPVVAKPAEPLQPLKQVPDAIPPAPTLSPSVSKLSVDGEGNLPVKKAVPDARVDETEVVIGGGASA